jgi:hypothetical protein
MKEKYSPLHPPEGDFYKNILPYNPPPGGMGGCISCGINNKVSPLGGINEYLEFSDDIHLLNPESKKRK